MIKPQLSFIGIIFLCVMTTILSASKNHVVIDNKNTENAEVMLDPNLNQSKCEPDCQDQKNPSEKVQNKTSKYTGVTWNKNCKSWQAQLGHNKKQYYGRLFDNEEHAAMKVNLLCDKHEIQRKNPTIMLEPDAILKKVQNKTSIYTGVTWNKNAKKWKAQLAYNKKIYFGGNFDNEEHAAMKINLLCDKYGIERKHLMINIALDVAQRIQTQTSKYTGVYWIKSNKKWKAQFQHNKKQYFGGYFDNEEHAGMKVNLLCDKYGIKRKNPMIDIELGAVQKNDIDNQIIDSGIENPAIGSETTNDDEDDSRNEKKRKRKKDDKSPSEQYYFYYDMLK